MAFQVQQAQAAGVVAALECLSGSRCPSVCFWLPLCLPLLSLSQSDLGLRMLTSLPQVLLMLRMYCPYPRPTLRMCSESSARRPAMLYHRRVPRRLPRVRFVRMRRCYGPLCQGRWGNSPFPRYQ